MAENHIVVLVPSQINLKNTPPDELFSVFTPFLKGNCVGAPQVAPVILQTALPSTNRKISFRSVNQHRQKEVGSCEEPEISGEMARKRPVTAEKLSVDSVVSEGTWLSCNSENMFRRTRTAIFESELKTCPRFAASSSCMGFMLPQYTGYYAVLFCRSLNRSSPPKTYEKHPKIIATSWEPDNGPKNTERRTLSGMIKYGDTNEQPFSI